MFVPAGERNIDVICRWLSTDKDRETAIRMPVAYAFVNNSGANDGDDDDTSRFLHHGTERDSFLLSRADHCARWYKDSEHAFLKITDKWCQEDRRNIFFARYEIIDGNNNLITRVFSDGFASI